MPEEKLTEFQKELLKAIRRWHYDSIDTIEKTVEQNLEAEEKAFNKLMALVMRAYDTNQGMYCQICGETLARYNRRGE